MACYSVFLGYGNTFGGTRRGDVLKMVGLLDVLIGEERERRERIRGKKIISTQKTSLL